MRISCAVGEREEAGVSAEQADGQAANQSKRRVHWTLQEEVVQERAVRNVAVYVWAHELLSETVWPTLRRHEERA